jgi:glutamate racemase
MGEEIELSNPGKSVEREAKQFLSKNDLSNGQKTSGKKEYYVTDLTDRFVSVAEMFLGEEIKGKINRVSLD